MNYSESTKKNRNKRIWWAIFTAFNYGLTPYVFHIARTDRVNNMPGGEIVMLFIPFIVLGMNKMITDLKEEWKKL